MQELHELRKMLEKNNADTKSILTLLQGDEFENPGLVKRVSSLEKSRHESEVRQARVLGGSVVIMFLIERVINFWSNK